jgi:hypothetical protein
VACSKRAGICIAGTQNLDSVLSAAAAAQLVRADMLLQSWQPSSIVSNTCSQQLSVALQQTCIHRVLTQRLVVTWHVPTSDFYVLQGK